MVAKAASKHNTASSQPAGGVRLWVADEANVPAGCVRWLRGSNHVAVTVVLVVMRFITMLAVEMVGKYM